MGGEDAWDRARYLEFDFVVDREGQEAARWSHRWDRWEGDYRLSGVRAGEPVVILFNVNRSDEGRAWVSGREVTGPPLDSLRRFGYQRFINDSYWLLMPYKWTDPGVQLTYEGPRSEAGRQWEAVRLRFADVGLTPQNQYLALINPETGLMERWYHYPNAEAQPSIFDWEDWRNFGGIMLATSKPSAAGPSRIWFDNIVVRRSVPEGAFVP
ncbi:MAG: hypothetical protein ACRELD_08535 [Longimicrobiales bacterium]